MIDQFRQDIEELEIWDADDSMDTQAIIEQIPQYHFLKKLEAFDPEVMHYLLYNISVKVIPPWEYYCKNKKLRSSLIAFKKFLMRKHWIDHLTPYIQAPILINREDCTYIDTSSAAETIFESLRTIVTKDVLYGTYALSCGATANSCLESNYLTWVKEIALPQAFKKEICNLEQTKLYCYPLYEDLYADLFEELDRV